MSLKSGKRPKLLDKIEAQATETAKDASNNIVIKAVKRVVKRARKITS